MSLSPKAMADAFSEWFKDNDLDGKLTKEQVRLLAEAFDAGMLYGITEAGR